MGLRSGNQKRKGGLRSGNRKRKWASEVVTGKEFGFQIWNWKKIFCFVTHSTRKLIAVEDLIGEYKFLVEWETKQQQKFLVTNLRSKYFSGYHFWSPFSFPVTNSEAHFIFRLPDLRPPILFRLPLLRHTLLSEFLENSGLLFYFNVLEKTNYDTVLSSQDWITY